MINEAENNYPYHLKVFQQFISREITGCVFDGQFMSMKNVIDTSVQF